MKPVPGSAIIPGLRPNWVGQLLLPLPMGARVGSYALTILHWVKGLPWVSRRDCLAIWGWASSATWSVVAKRSRGPSASGVASGKCLGAVRTSGKRGWPPSSSCFSVWRPTVTNTLPLPRHCRPKRRIICWRSCCSRPARVFSSAPAVAHWSGKCARTWRIFLRLIQRRGISAPVAAVLTGKGINHQMRGADQALLHGRGCLDGQPFLHPGFVQMAAKLGEHCGQDKGLLGTVHVDFLDSARLPHRKIGPQPATDLFSGTRHLRFEQL